MPKKMLCGLLALFLCCFLTRAISAQTDAQSVTGKVTDQSGGAIVTALVTLLDSQTGKARTTTTDVNGEFTFGNVVGGTYRLSVEKPGFVSLSQDVVPGEPLTRLVLQVSGVSDVVEVSAESYLVTDATTAAKINAPLRDIPQSVQVINQNLLRDRATFNFAEAVTQNVSGVTRHTTDLTGSGAGDFLRLRGFSGSYNNSYLRDGLKFVNYGATEIADVERIEVLKGTSSVLYGRAEPGGVINFLTKEPLSQRSLSVELTGGNFDFFRGHLDTTGTVFGSDKFFYRFNGIYQYEGNFRDVAGGKRVFLAPTFFWKPVEKLQLKFGGNYLREVRGADVGLVAVNGRPADVDIERNYGEPFNRAYQQNRNSNVRGRYDFNGKWSVQSAYQTQFLDYSLFAAFPAFFGGPAVAPDGKTIIRDFASTDYTERWHYVDTTVTGSFSTGKVRHNLVGGFEFGVQRGIYHHDFYLGYFLGPAAFPSTDVFQPTAPLSYEFVQNFIRSTQAFVFPSYYRLRIKAAGGYVQDLMTLTRQLKLLVGARFDRYQQRYLDEPTNALQNTTDKRVSPRVGLVYQPVELISLYASYGSSFSPQFPGQLTVDNRALKPSVGEQYEAGVRLNAWQGTLQATLALYNLTFRDLLVADPRNPGFSIQTGEQRSRGLELDVTANPWRGFNLTGTYAATQASVTEDTTAQLVGRFLPNTARHSGNLWATYRFDETSRFNGFGFGFGVQAVGKRFTNLANDTILPAFGRADATAFYERDASEKTRIRFAINFQNLTNHRYSASATPFASFIFPGAPFTVLGSVKITRR